MPTRVTQRIAFDTSVDIGVAGGTGNYTLDAIDLSWADEITMRVSFTKANTDAGDTCDVYLQSRGPDGIWTDRIASHQLTGDMSPTTADPEVRDYVLQQFGTFSDAEEGAETSGSLGGSRLTAGTVRNGSFPGLFKTAGSPMTPGWRIQIVVVDAGTDNADFEGTVYLSTNSSP